MNSVMPPGKMTNSMIFKVVEFTGVYLFGAFGVWFTDFNLGNIEWLKFPIGASMVTILYMFVQYYTSKRKYDLEDFRILIEEYKELNETLEKKNLALQVTIDDLRGELEKLKRANNGR